MLLRCFFKTYFRPTVPHFSFIVLRYSTTVDYKIVNSYWTRNFGPLIATIVKNQWFSGSPLPLNEWFGKHPLEPMEWQWFFSMATMGTNGMAMVLNGLQPLVKRWDGSDPSLWSKWWWLSCVVLNWTYKLTKSTNKEKETKRLNPKISDLFALLCGRPPRNPCQWVDQRCH